jgi:crotonobetaine/carnitine-CoA ligase
MMMATPVVADEKPILLHIDEGARVAKITLNRPRCLNAINLPLLKMLVEGLEKVKVGLAVSQATKLLTTIFQSSCAKVCIVQSSSKHFCSGEGLLRFLKRVCYQLTASCIDLKQTLAPASKGKDSDELRRSLELLQDITRLMTTSSAIFIACVEGWAIGGGAEVRLVLTYSNTPSRMHVDRSRCRFGHRCKFCNFQVSGS